MNIPVKFPKGFWWGTATAAHQVEGNNVNNDNWLFEHTPGTIFTEPSGDACDHYHRYREDIALLAELGFNMYRFSLEWSRIEPEEGQFSRASLEHYRRMLSTCHEHGLTPMVTFHHFTSPKWLIASGGWEDKDTPDKFARYCERATRYLGDLMGAACTLNEGNIAPLLAKMGVLPPAPQMHQAPWWSAAARALGIAPDRLAPFIFTVSPGAVDTILTTHRRAVAAIKAGPGDFPVGLTLALQDIQAADRLQPEFPDLRRLMADHQFAAVVGMDVSGRVLDLAESRLKLDRLAPKQRERIRLMHGSLMYRDPRLAGFDAASVVEVIEHLDQPRLRAFERVLFESARPATVALTTPNAEYNVKWPTLPAGKFRHQDHRFEWTRAEFQNWANDVATRFGYGVTYRPVGDEDSTVGPPTQMAVFAR
jgi:hypothetical protein